jgi:small-conductance mechanosensitive channel
LTPPAAVGNIPAMAVAVKQDLPGHEELLSSQWWHERLAKSLDWLIDDGLRIVVILVLLFVILKFARTFVRRTVLLAVRPRGNDALRDLMITKRQTTLTSLFDAVVTITVLTVAGMMILQALGFSVGPLLASAGIAGVAIGFGAQSLVKDILSGTFIILEQQFSVGDVVKASNVSGAVEEINLRTTLLRDADGSVHIIPNGQITQVSVLTRDWSRLLLDLDIAYDADIDVATSILKKEFDAYAAEHSDLVVEPPEVLGVQNLAENSVQIRVWMKMVPGKQWAAGRELRARVKKAFDAAGIEIPFPQRTLWVRQEKPGELTPPSA